jgi:uridine kinase
MNFIKNLKELNQIISIVILKIIVLGLFSSQYSLELFQPFVGSFINESNFPWQYYFENNYNIDSFPYHPLMLYILSLGVIFIDFFSIDSFFFSNLIFKIPLLISDLIIFTILLKLFPLKQSKVKIFYLLNPIIFYAIYMHSQLDIIPMALLFLAIYFLVNEKFKISSVFLGLGFATKFHLLIAFPLILIFIYKKYNFHKVLQYFFISILILLIFDLPFLGNEGFQEMVLFNPKQSLLFDSFFKIGDLSFLLPIFALLIVYLNFLNLDFINNDFLFFYLGVLFTSVIFFIYPAPAWYVWLVPFLSIYFINNKNLKKSIIFYTCFSVSYLLFFIFSYSSDYIDISFLGNYLNYKIVNDNLINLSFTILLSMLITCMLAFYRYGSRSNSLYNRKLNTTIGIGGNSAAGKTTFLENLNLLFINKFLKIEGDGDHKWERGDENWKKFTHLDPKANFIHKQADAINDLKNNKSILRCDYDHSSGTFTKAIKIIPKQFIAISGLHPFYLPKQRKNIDLKIYFDTQDQLRKYWKINRDVSQRNHKINKVIEQINFRKEDSEKFILPQKEFADLIIEYFSIDKINIEKENEEYNLSLKIVVNANLRLDDLLNDLDCEFVWDYNSDLKTQYIILNKEPKLDFKYFANSNIPNLNEIVSLNSVWLGGYSGLLQTISVMLISDKLK